MKELEVRADGDELSTVIAFVDEQIETVGCSGGAVYDDVEDTYK